MEDITPLNLEDSPKLFGLRYDQLITVLVSMMISTQLYSWMDPVKIGGHEIRLYVSIFIFMIGPVYCLVSMNNGVSNWEAIVNHYIAPSVYIPGPDPNPTRFLIDEELVDFCE